MKVTVLYDSSVSDSILVGMIGLKCYQGNTVTLHDLKGKNTSAITTVIAGISATSQNKIILGTIVEGSLRTTVITSITSSSKEVVVMGDLRTELANSNTFDISGTGNVYIDGTYTVNTITYSSTYNTSTIVTSEAIADDAITGTATYAHKKRATGDLTAAQKITLDSKLLTAVNGGDSATMTYAPNYGQSISKLLWDAIFNSIQITRAYPYVSEYLLQNYGLVKYNNEAGNFPYGLKVLFSDLSDNATVEKALTLLDTSIVTPTQISQFAFKVSYALYAGHVVLQTAGTYAVATETQGGYVKGQIYLATSTGWLQASLTADSVMLATVKLVDSVAAEIYGINTIWTYNTSTGAWLELTYAGTHITYQLTGTYDVPFVKSVFDEVIAAGNNVAEAITIGIVSAVA